MRLFFACTLPESFREALAAETAALKAAHPDFRWTPGENLHITLAFLGEVDRAAIPLLAGVLREAFPAPPDIAFRTGKLFTLPRRGEPNVLALGFETGAEAIAAAADRIETALARLAAEGRCPFRPRDRRPFTAHLTLARRGRQPMRLDSAAAGLRPVALDSRVEKVVLYRSELTPQGAVYTPLESVDDSGRVSGHVNKFP